MFKHRQQGSRKSAGFIPPNIFGSSTSSAPLLSSAQNPGRSTGDYNRLSENSSPASTPGSPGSLRYGPSAGNNMSNARYGPTASFPNSSQASDIGSVGSQAQLRGRGVPPAGAGAGAAASRGYAGGPEDDDELDDALHTFTAADRKDLASPFTLSSWRGWANGITLFVLLAGFVILFAGYPIINHYTSDTSSQGSLASGFNLGGVNGSGQVPEFVHFPDRVDNDTDPNIRYTARKSPFDGGKDDWTLVFSDEFEKDGRTFFNGDDPYWEAVDLHYWPTGDLEWYDPSAVSTRDGKMIIKVTQEPLHDLMFKSGMIQSWNKLCFFKNAYIEVAAVLPGVDSVPGFWPGIWTMGNLGRPGYGATNDGMWPYSYSSCDVGVAPNQTWVNGTGPAGTKTGIVWEDGVQVPGHTLSYLPGQRLTSCNCDMNDHPGPKGVGRGVVEIDIIEAQINHETRKSGQVSQSAQIAPFDDYYQFDNKSSTIYDSDTTVFNNYLGGPLQQAASALGNVDHSAYTNTSGKMAVYGMEFYSDFDNPQNSYIGWINMGKPSWKLDADAFAANPRVDIGRRLITQEPMSIILNMGISNSFDAVDFNRLTFPNEMQIDYVRVWQKDGGSITCDPPERPTADYIKKHINAYSNANLTTWAQAGYTTPKNKYLGC